MTQPNKISTLLYFEWSPPWDFKAYLLTYYSDILPNILSGRYSDILSAILFGIYCGILSYLWVEMQTTHSYLQILVMLDFFMGLTPLMLHLFLNVLDVFYPYRPAKRAFWKWDDPLAWANDALWCVLHGKSRLPRGRAQEHMPAIMVIMLLFSEIVNVLSGMMVPVTQYHCWFFYNLFCHLMHPNVDISTVSKHEPDI